MHKNIHLLLVTVLLLLNGCSGCSRAGKESKRRLLATSEDKYSSGNLETSSYKMPNRKDNSSSKAKHTSGLSKLYENNKEGVFLVFSTNDGNSGAQGSGFFISPRGVGISNQHVFDGFGTHYIKLYNGSTYEVTEIIRSSEASELDYVIFKVNTRGDKILSLPIATTLPAIGENVFAIGNPKGLEHTLSTGIVSSYRDNDKLIQTTAEITSGSSGGPLFNMQGEVVGITTSGVGEANLNFAVNIKRLNLN